MSSERYSVCGLVNRNGVRHGVVFDETAKVHFYVPIVDSPPNPTLLKPVLVRCTDGIVLLCPVNSSLVDLTDVTLAADPRQQQVVGTAPATAAPVVVDQRLASTADALRSALLHRKNARTKDMYYGEKR